MPANVETMYNTNFSLKVYALCLRQNATKSLRKNHLSKFLLDFCTLFNGNKYYTRVAPWHCLGTRVENALSSEEALKASGLDWKVYQQPIVTSSGTPISGYKANIRSTDEHVLGVVSDRYKVVQNAEAFAFTDALLGEGVKYETAGALHNSERVISLNN